MAKVYAIRNIGLCTKDCLCLYVCPTGASDTENSIIDKAKCIGCSACANACPSGAISLIPRTMPPQQKHSEDVIKAMRLLFSSKINQENLSSTLPNKLAKALEKSNRIMAEDIIRESGYMLPQSGNAKILLHDLLEKTPECEATINALLENLDFNEEVEIKKSEKWQCKVCGYKHIGKLPEKFNCPVCAQPKSYFELVK